MRFLWERISYYTIPLTPQCCTFFHLALHRSNVGEVQSSNYPISALTVGNITHYAPPHLTHSPSQSIYHTCLPYPIRLPTTLPSHIRITSSFSSVVSSSMFRAWIPISLHPPTCSSQSQTVGIQWLCCLLHDVPALPPYIHLCKKYTNSLKESGSSITVFVTTLIIVINGYLFCSKFILD